MNKINTFISGNEYSLRELFGGDTKIVIPDLQRDYCWGNNALTSDGQHRELVTNFVKNIVELFEQNKERKNTLGLIYGYEQPHNHIQICDGQQRLTTLFLLLGFINTKANGAFSQYIISPKEMEDDNEPHLQYAIRESTLYFLSDLARKSFVDNKTDLSSIKESDWYFNEYEQDASIQSMIAALNSINTFFAKKTDFDFKDLGDFVLDKLCVLYYDMETRYRGEETYVVINTTGEPLTATENIKPILLGNLSEEQSKEYSEQWEEREDWFWKNRGKDRTADIGMNKFFEWYWQIGLIRENNWNNGRKEALNPRDLFLYDPQNTTENENEVSISKDNYKKFKSLDNLNDYFTALTILVDRIKKCPNFQKVLLTMAPKNKANAMQDESEVWNWLRSADQDIVLPLLAFVAKYRSDIEKDSDILYRFIRRLRKNRYDSVWAKNGNVQSRRALNYMDWRYLIQIINQISTVNDLFTADINTLKIQRIPNLNLPIWFNDDEMAKAKLLSENNIELDEMEDNELLMGDLTPLWYNKETKECYSYDEVLKRWEVLKRICWAFDPEKAKNDIPFANWFRLYRLIEGLTDIQHVYNHPYTFEGCFYSQKTDLPFWIESEQIEELLNRKDDDCISFMKNHIKNRVNSFIHAPNDHKELLKGWLTIKTLQAEESQELLNHWNGRAISAYVKMEDNYIVPNTEFHWGNVICGYSFSSNDAVRPAQDENNWNKKCNLDSPITAVDYNNYYNKRDSIDIEAIDKYDEEIKMLLDNFIGKEE